MFEGFFPHRRDVDFFEADDLSITTMIERLSFIKDKQKWSFAFRFGHLEISRDDFLTIASAMVDENILNQIKGEI